MKKEKTKKKGRVLKGILIGLLSVVALIAVAIGGYNGIKYWRFSDFYAVRKNLRKNPGLSDGYITQGLCYLEDIDTYLTSGYMTDKKKPSRVYSVDKDNKSHFCELFRKDKDGNEVAFTYHCGGVASEGDYVMTACNKNVYVFSKEDILTKDKAVVVSAFAVNNNASFIFSSGEDVYVGEFNDVKNHYTTDHEYKVADDEIYQAIISKYSLTDVLNQKEAAPSREFVIRDRVQGMCVTSKGNIVVDTSWGMNPSHMYVYQDTGKADAKDGEIPVTFLDSTCLIKDLTCPSMFEDLDYYNGQVLVTSESASTKYIYGKFCFYNHIYGVTLD